MNKFEIILSVVSLVVGGAVALIEGRRMSQESSTRERLAALENEVSHVNGDLSKMDDYASNLFERVSSLEAKRTPVAKKAPKRAKG
jgi:BMFP domain-containing protein YqiC